MLIAVMNIIQFEYTIWLGLGLVISSYIVPNLVKNDNCDDGSCSISEGTVKK